MFQSIKRSLVALVLLTGALAWGGDVTQVKGTKALLTLGGEPAAVGSEFFAVDAQGKRKAILKVRQIKGDRAIADILKGAATVGMTLKPRPAPGGVAATDAGAAAEGGSTSARPKGFMGRFLKKGRGIGLLAGMSQNKMSLTAKKTGVGEQALDLTGNSFNLVGYYDYDFSSFLTFQGRLGLETFTVAGSTKLPALCGNSTNCNVSFNYLATEANLKLNLLRGSTRVWLGGGMAFLVAVGKSSNIVNLDTSNATNQMFTAGLGADIGLSGGAVIPVAVEMGMFPGSSSVKASSTIVRIGYGWRY